MKINKFKKFVAKNALPLVLGGVVIVAGAVGVYYYANKQGEKLAATNNQSTQTKTQTPTPAQTPAQTKGDNTNTGQSTTSTTTTPVATTSIGDVSLLVTKNPDVPTTASVAFYGPAGTYGVEKLENSSWTTVVANFSYSGSGGYVFDTINSSAAETHYRVFSLSGNTRTATSGDTVIEWSLVNENGIYTIPIAR
jgi:hypothetical protein